MDDEELHALAVQEILEETKRGKIRAEVAGSLGWRKCPIGKANKRFLGNLVLSAASDRARANKRKQTDEKREDKVTQSTSESESRLKTPMDECKREDRKRRHSTRSEKSSDTRKRKKDKKDERT